MKRTIYLYNNQPVPDGVDNIIEKKEIIKGFLTIIYFMDYN